MSNHRSHTPLRAALAAACCLVASVASAHYTYEVFDVPGAAATAGIGLNDKGEVVGNYMPVGGTDFLGFVRSASGVITPLSVAGQSQSLPTDIDGSGRIVGTCPTAVCPGMGFVLSPSGGLDLTGPAGATSWVPWGINDAGWISVSYAGAAGNSGLLWKGGALVPVLSPEGTFAEPRNSNLAGHVAGSFGNAGGTHGFFFDGTGYTVLDYPGATETQAWGINDHDEIVGTSGNGVDEWAWVRHPDGNWETVGPAGSSYGRAEDINSSGQIVGYFWDGSVGHAYLATPTAPVPEPCSLALMLGGGLFVTWRRRATVAAVALALVAAAALPAHADLGTDALTLSRPMVGSSPAPVEHSSPVAAPVDAASLLESYPSAAVGTRASASSQVRVGEINLTVDVLSYETVGTGGCCSIAVADSHARGSWADNLHVFDAAGHALLSGSLQGNAVVGSSISALLGSITGIAGANGSVQAFAQGASGGVAGGFNDSTCPCDGHWNTFPSATIPYTVNISGGIAQVAFSLVLDANTASYPGRDYSSNVMASASLTAGTVDAVFDASGHALAAGWTVRGDSGHIYSPVPEPRAAALWLAGLAVVGALSRRQRPRD